jgi:hypothetical protein
MLLKIAGRCDASHVREWLTVLAGGGENIHRHFFQRI